MFDLSFGEILLVVLVAAVFIGPKEIPVVVRGIARFMKSLRALASEVRSAFNELSEESGIKKMSEELNAEMRMIEGDDGQMYESYDIKNIMPENDKKRA